MTVGGVGLIDINAPYTCTGHLALGDTFLNQELSNILTSSYGKATIDGRGTCMTVSGTDNFQPKVIVLDGSGNLTDIVHLAYIDKLGRVDLKEEQHWCIKGYGSRTVTYTKTTA